ncbi:ORF008 [Saltwater crocodilepox virus]|nr:hypothetical protein [Saltwater crocodilepox virus]AVD69345.1 hypothetical protein [Saltwater crocodilepox virus]QGT46447.1 ORF008 [Saltwater crocodilepox virus]QGT46663.1 ORF008 [Saltwater crocodilepox virus]QGT46880.1 ORF008 [Saltwater crocodilepox virus]
MVAITIPPLLSGEKKPKDDPAVSEKQKADKRHSDACLAHEEWRRAHKQAQNDERELALMKCIFVSAVVIAITLMWVMVLFLISKMSSGGRVADLQPTLPRNCVFGDYSHVPPGPNDAGAGGCTVIGDASANVSDANGMPILAVVAYWNATKKRNIPCTVELVTSAGQTSGIQVSNQGNTDSMSVFALNSTCFGEYQSVSMSCSVQFPGKMLIVACGGSTSLLLFEMNNRLPNTGSMLTMYYS